MATFDTETNSIQWCSGNSYEWRDFQTANAHATSQLECNPSITHRYIAHTTTTELSVQDRQTARQKTALADRGLWTVTQHAVQTSHFTISQCLNCFLTRHWLLSKNVQLLVNFNDVFGFCFLHESKYTPINKYVFDVYNQNSTSPLMHHNYIYWKHYYTLFWSASSFHFFKKPLQAASNFFSQNSKLLSENCLLILAFSCKVTSSLTDGDKTHRNQSTSLMVEGSINSSIN